MKNRAKCMKCQAVIESYHDTDYVHCKCGECWVDGGMALYCGVTTSWDNFRRIDENGNELIVTVKPLKKDAPIEITRKDKIKILKDLIDSIENLPKEALSTYVTHYDLLSSLIILFAILKEDCKDVS